MAGPKLKIKLVWPGLARIGPGPRPGLGQGLGILRGADLHENAPFVEKICFMSILVISEPSRPQKWIRLEILLGIDPALEVKIEAISSEIKGQS